MKKNAVVVWSIGRLLSPIVIELRVGVAREAAEGLMYVIEENGPASARSNMECIVGAVVDGAKVANR